MQVRASKMRPEAEPAALPENYPRRVSSTHKKTFPPSVARPQPIRASGLGVVAWFTGLSGAGKTTLARAAMARLHAAGQPAQLLDGDDLRLGLCAGLGFRREDREENLRRAACAAELLARTGTTVLVATISPYEAIRQEMRRRFPRFVEIYVNAPLGVCEKRDPKGLYRRARAGEIAHFTGLDDIYEPPLHPEVECRTDCQSITESVELIVRAVSYARFAPDDKPMETRPDALRPALEALSRRRTTLTEFARLAGVPLYTAARMVRATTGWSFRELHRALLTERAQTLLRSGRAVKVVAIELGFSCSGSLCRFLRSSRARTPPAFPSARDRFPDSKWLAGAPRPAAE